MVPKVVDFLTIIIEKVTQADGTKTKKTGYLYALGMEWKNTNPLANNSLIKIIDNEVKFCFYSFTYTSRVWFLRRLLGIPMKGYSYL